MNYTISNEKLTLVVSSKGGEFQSVKDAEGQEYLWQGDAATVSYTHLDVYKRQI